MASSPSVRNKSSSRRPYRFRKWRLVELFHLPQVRPQEKEALARRRRATRLELLLVLRRALSLGLRLRPSGTPERARSLRWQGAGQTIARSQTPAHNDDASQHDRLSARSTRSSTEGQGRIGRGIAIHARLSASQSRNRGHPRSQATMESQNSRSPRTSLGSSANSYPGSSSIRRHASSNSRGEPHVTCP